MCKFKKEMILYHYTNLESFEKIIESRTIRLYNPTVDNNTELHLSSEKFYELIEPTFKNFSKEIQKKLMEEYESLKENIDKGEETSRFNFYSFSTTTEKNSAKHWEKYGDDGKGICLGFDKKILEKISYIGIHNQLQSFDILPMIYSDEQITVAVTKWIKWALSSEPSSISKHPLSYLYANVFDVKKDKEYSHYNETRIFITEENIESLLSLPDSEGIISEYMSDIKLNEPPQYDKCRKYRNMNLTQWWNSNLVPEIRITTKCSADVSKIKKLLEKNNLTNTPICFDDVI